MGGAGREARRKGEVMSGCGGTVDGESNDDSAESQLEKAGYGGKLDTGLIGDASKAEKLVWKDGVCIIDNCPTRPGKTKVAQCSICKLCQGWFDKGKDPSNIYKPEIASFWSIIEANFSEKRKMTDLTVEHYQQHQANCDGLCTITDDMMREEPDLMRCVTCPFCKETVDAILTPTSISCPKCKTVVQR
jgi:hypothetical protein